MMQLFRILTYWLAAVWMAEAAEVSIPQYEPGDVASSDVVAPFEFAVVNPEQTDRLRQQELEKVPAIYRFNPWLAVQAEEKFSLVFTKTRGAFLSAMETASGKRQLDELTLTHPSFWRFVDWFKAQHPAFPLTTNLATSWALGDPEDQAIQFRLQSALRDIMGRYIRPDTVPGYADTSQAHIVPVDKPAARLTLADVATKAELVARPGILTLAEARAALALRAGDYGEEMGNFLATFLKENILFDDWLTSQKRQHRAAELVVFDQYSPGQLVLRTGQIVDARAKAALDVLAAAMERQRTRVAVATPPSSTEELRARLLAFMANMDAAVRRYPWLLLIFAALLLGAFWRLVTRRAHVTSSPTCEAYTVVMNPSRQETVFLPLTNAPASSSFGGQNVTLLSGETTSTPWQTELREAEHRAEELLALVRAGLAPHLAKELTHKLVQELVSQRATLVRAHELAEQEMAALETRFEKVHRDLQQRIEAYEKRAGELEKELVAKTEQTRELMKATILLTQQKLDSKKPGDEFACN
jgi:hypothetical protein